jgi:hypothetical protein
MEQSTASSDMVLNPTTGFSLETAGLVRHQALIVARRMLSYVNK